MAKSAARTPKHIESGLYASNSARHHRAPRATRRARRSCARGARAPARHSSGRCRQHESSTPHPPYSSSRTLPTAATCRPTGASHRRGPGPADPSTRARRNAHSHSAACALNAVRGSPGGQARGGGEGCGDLSSASASGHDLRLGLRVVAIASPLDARYEGAHLKACATCRSSRFACSTASTHLVWVCKVVSVYAHNGVLQYS